MKQKNVITVALVLLLSPALLWAQKTPEPSARKEPMARSEFYPMTKAHVTDNQEATRLLRLSLDQSSTSWRAPLTELVKKPEQHPSNLYKIALRLRHLEGETVSKPIFERIVSIVDARTKMMRRAPPNNMLLYKGISLYALQKFDDAFASLNRIKKRKVPEWYFTPCDTVFGFKNLAGMGDFEQRSAWLASYQQRFPQCENAIHKATLTDLFTRGRLKSVVKLLDERLKQGLPSRDEALRISSLYIQAKKAEKAISLLHKMCRNIPCDEELRARIFRASTRVFPDQERRSNKTNEIFDQAKASPEDPLFQYEAAFAAYFSEKYSTSLIFFKKAERQWPKDPHILALKAMALLQTGAQKEAEKAIERAISEPENPLVRVMLFRAIIYRNVRLDRAIESITLYREVMTSFRQMDLREKAHILAFEQVLRTERDRREKGAAPRKFGDYVSLRLGPVSDAAMGSGDVTPQNANECTHSLYNCTPDPEKEQLKKLGPIQTHKLVPEMMKQLKAGTISLTTGPPAIARQGSPRAPSPTQAVAKPALAPPEKSTTKNEPPKVGVALAQAPPKPRSTPTAPAKAETEPKGPLWVVIGVSVLLSLSLFALFFVRNRKSKNRV